MPFITFEGVEGSGKSTQLKLAAARLRARRRPVLATREPGGTRIGRILRSALLPSAHRELDSVAEWLLFEADRRQHVVEVVRPALEKERYVLCDRFSDTTEAYQIVGRGLDARLGAASTRSRATGSCPISPSCSTSSRDRPGAREPARRAKRRAFRESGLRVPREGPARIPRDRAPGTRARTRARREPAGREAVPRHVEALAERFTV